MKKLFAAILALIMILSLASALADPVFDMATYSEYDSLFDIQEDPESHNAFVMTKMETESLAYTHKYESDSLYSFIQSDIIVLDYDSAEAFPILRTWIYYCADEPLGIESVSFVVDGITYTLTDVTDGDGGFVDERGSCEELLIIYGTDNWEFFTAMMANSISYASMSQNETDTVDPPDMKMILHGKEDVEVDVPANCLFDYGLLAMPFLSSDDWLQFVLEMDGNPCEVID